MCPYAVFVPAQNILRVSGFTWTVSFTLSLSFFMVLMWFRYHSTSLLEMITKRVPSLLFCTDKSHTLGGGQDFTLVHKQEWTTCKIQKNKRHSRKPQHTYFFTQCQSWLVFAFITSSSQARKKSTLAVLWNITDHQLRTCEDQKRCAQVRMWSYLLARILRESSECSSVNTRGFSQQAPTRPAWVLEEKHIDICIQLEFFLLVRGRGRSKSLWEINI